MPTGGFFFCVSVANGDVILRSLYILHIKKINGMLLHVIVRRLERKVVHNAAK